MNPLGSVLGHHHQISDTSPPRGLVMEPAGALVFGQPHLVLEVLLSLYLQQGVDVWLYKSVLLRNRRAVTPIVFRCLVYFFTVNQVLSIGFDDVLDHLQSVIFPRTLLEQRQRGVGPSYHFAVSFFSVAQFTIFLTLAVSHAASSSISE